MAGRPATRNLGRLSEIAQAAVRHGFGYFLETHRRTDLLPWTGGRVAAADGAPSHRGQHLRELLDDLALLYQAARLAKERVRALDFIDARQLVDEFARAIRQELDYRLEARNAEAFRRNFAAAPEVLIPRPYWSYTRERVLTLEWLEGTKLADLDPASLTPEQSRRLPYLMAGTGMMMIFRHGVFHGDPHPANVFVLDHERIGLVDFGQVGQLSD